MSLRRINWHSTADVRSETRYTTPGRKKSASLDTGSPRRQRKFNWRINRLFRRGTSETEVGFDESLKLSRDDLPHNCSAPIQECKTQTCHRYIKNTSVEKCHEVEQPAIVIEETDQVSSSSEGLDPPARNRRGSLTNILSKSLLSLKIGGNNKLHRALSLDSSLQQTTKQSTSYSKYQKLKRGFTTIGSQTCKTQKPPESARPKHLDLDFSSGENFVSVMQEFMGPILIIVVGEMVAVMHYAASQLLRGLFNSQSSRACYMIATTVYDFATIPDAR